MQKYFVWGGVALVIILVLVGLLRLGKRGVAAKAFENLANADSFHTQTELLINLPERFRGQERPFTKTIARVDGDVKKTEDKTPEFSGSLYLEARGRGNIFFADGQTRIMRDRVVFNLDNVPVFLNPSGSLVKKWTKVETSLLQAKNGGEVRDALNNILKKATPAGKETVPFDGAQGKGEQLARFSITLAAEEEKILAGIFRQSASGSPALNTLARLLDANVVKEFVIWVDGKEIRQIRVHFVRPLSGGREFDFATLTLQFTDYNKDVAIDAPETKRSVKPEAFAKIFGGQHRVEDVKVAD